jgi:hypothetical protein
VRCGRGATGGPGGVGADTRGVGGRAGDGGPTRAGGARQAGLLGPDGALDNNDFIAFIDLFFGRSPLADIGAQGGVEGRDDAWDNNDFIVFIGWFFSGE